MHKVDRLKTIQTVIDADLMSLITAWLHLIKMYAGEIAPVSSSSVPRDGMALGNVAENASTRALLVKSPITPVEVQNLMSAFNKANGPWVRRWPCAWATGRAKPSQATGAGQWTQRRQRQDDHYGRSPYVKICLLTATAVSIPSWCSKGSENLADARMSNLWVQALKNTRSAMSCGRIHRIR
jgi:hypothetical protein